MIPFFRKIRKKMADDNRPLKYMRYAIGEIVLVVVGILIALQINNWNEEIEETRIESLYYERLSDDIKVDISYYTKRINQAQNDNKHLTIFISQMYQIQNSTDKIIELFSHLNMNTDPFQTANSTFQELLSTGDFRTFTNDSLKKTIIEYYRTNDDYNNQMEEFNQVCTSLLIENAVTNPNISKALSIIVSPEVANPVFEGEFEYLNDPSSHKFQILRTTAGFYRHRNSEHLQILEQMKSNAQKVLSRVEEEFNITDQ